MGSIFLMGTSAAALMRALPDVIDPPPPIASATGVPYAYINFSEYVGATSTPTQTYSSRGLHPTLLPNIVSNVASTDGPPGVARYFNNTTQLTAAKMFQSVYPEDRMHPTAPFTYEAWFRTTVAEGNSRTNEVVAEGHSFSAYRWKILCIAPNTVPSVDYFRFIAFVTEGGSLVSIDSQTFPRNTWQHVAVTRDEDGLVRLFRNGVMEASLSVPSIAYPTVATNLYLRGGCDQGGNGGLLDMALFRMETNKCLYEGDFTPPGDADFNFGDHSGDPFFDEVILAFPFDGLNTTANSYGTRQFGKVLLDSLSLGGNAIATSPPRTTSRAINQSTSAFAVGNFTTENSNALFSHAGKSLTAEYWWQTPLTRSNVAIAGGMGRWLATGDQRSWWFGINVAGGVNYITLHYSTTGADTVILTGTTPLTLNSWYHLAFTYDRITGTIRLFVNGVMEVKQTGVPNLFDNAERFFMTNWGSSLGYVNSFYDDVRVTYASRYKSDSGFSPPTKIPAYRQYDPDWNNVIAIYDTRSTSADSTRPLVRTPPTRHGLSARGLNSNGMVSNDSPIVPKFNRTTNATQTGTGQATMNLTHGATYDPLSDQFCFEGWAFFREESGTTAEGMIICYNQVFQLGIRETQGIRLYWRLSADGGFLNSQIITTNDFPRNEFFYLAATRDSSGVMRIYVDGVLKATSDPILTEELFTPATKATYFCANTDVGGNAFTEVHGGVEDWRVSRVARYTGAAHPVPTTIHARGPSGDPHWTNVVLLISPSLSGGSAPGRDLSWRTQIMNNPSGVSIGTTVPGPFASVYPGDTGRVWNTTAETGQYPIAAAQAGDFNLRGVEWTVEFHTYMNTASATGTGDRAGVSHYTNTNGQKQWALGFNGRTPKASVSENGSAEITILGSPLADFEWHHIALTRDADKVVRMFVNGVLAGSVTLTDDLFNLTRQLQLFSYGTSRGQTNRVYDDGRITRGVCRYVADFTPPTAPHPLYATLPD